MVAIGITTRGRLAADFVAVGCFEGEPPPLDRLPESLARAARRIAERVGWKGRDGQSGETEVGDDGSRGREQIVRLWGLGREASCERHRLLAWLDEATLAARASGARRAAIVLPEHAETRGVDAAERILRRLLLSEYAFDRFRRLNELGRLRLGKILLLPPAREERAYRARLPRARVAAAAVALARDLANAPANEAGPEWMAERCLEIAAARGFDATVLGRRELEEHGMGGVLAVGLGSRRPPRLVRLEHGAGGPLVALVGKGVTFDSGGLSIKPSEGMESMKYDKAGAAAVLAAAAAAVDLELPLRLRVYLPLAENMPGGGAYRPGDIVRCKNGLHVEIVNTDAEGRLLLADAMAWAVEEGAESLVELSTLTGGAITALGAAGSPLFAGDDALRRELLAASEAAGERLWPMPLWPEHREAMRGAQADLKNSAGKPGSPCTAAAFLSHFVGDLERWAHLDISGTAQLADDGAASGFGVATLIAWLAAHAEADAAESAA